MLKKKGTDKPRAGWVCS